MTRSRFRQADREAWITLAVYAAFFVWWTVGAYGLGSFADTMVLGLPAWFLVSCVLGYPLVCVGLWWVIRRCFHDMTLDSDGAAPDAVSADTAVSGSSPAAAEKSPATPEARS